MTSPLIRTSPYLTMVTEVREVLRLPPMGFSAASRTTDELVTEVLGLPRAVHRQVPGGRVYSTLQGASRMAVSGSTVVNAVVLACDALEAGAGGPVDEELRQALRALAARVILDEWLNRGLGFEEVPAPLVLTVDVDTQGWM